MLSYWEKIQLTNYDHIVVGGGIVGLSTAASIIEKYPEASVAVLERGILPTGASTKNAGFACFGSLTELLNDIKTIGKEGTLDLVKQRWNGLQLLQQRLGKEALEYEGNGGYELISEQEEPALEALEEVNELLYPLFGQEVFSMCDEQIASFGFAKDTVKHMVYNPFEGQINTGKMMDALWLYVQQKGVRIITGSEVINIEEGTDKVAVTIQNTLSQEPIVFTAEQVAICTNAFSKKLLPTLDLYPGRGQVLVTKPIASLPFKGVFHMDEGYYYFRNHGNRIIFGGGRNLDIQGETTTQMENTSLIMGVLQEKLKQVILPDQEFEIEHQWAGVMAFGENKQPVCQRISDRQVIGLRLGGMGVAIGSGLGEQLASIL
ncbi:FAD-dependent oxidoreductase [Algivirga pacifica]|uniref:FAD-dependent oxidoreductase n=1 Tax=Algivirga pacifica TaxID=1162670 RepID=A0ABP9DNK8_9BACT